MPDIVLIHSPLVGPTSLAPTQKALERAGHICHLPTAYAAGAEIPPWRDWPDRLAEALPEMDRPVIAGHSMGGLLAARLAADLNASGMICLDAAIPPDSGTVLPVEPTFRAFLDTLPVQDGVLPPWNDWWTVDIFEGGDVSDAEKETFLADIPALRRDWFDDSFAMPDWSRAKRTYLRTSLSFVEEARRAGSLGWPVIRLKGTHLHPFAEPEETADAILQCRAAMGL
ncbi:alpha/beta hydrolase [Parasphingopyxis sp.]|uniref:alpha/beta hydrolase n=1 Tax=Parasphingopyxis sp. TaxID=1920299 RepID=UPI002630A2A0|nr:alpha/beta hydrolase [Parasphingopyxis sp.]